MKDTFSFLLKTKASRRFLLVIFIPFLYNMYVLFTSAGHSARFDSYFGTRAPEFVFSLILSIAMPVVIILLVVLFRIIVINLRTGK